MLDQEKILNLLLQTYKEINLQVNQIIIVLNGLVKIQDLIEMRKVKVHMNKPIYLGMIILDISKILIYEFLYDYLKPKYKENFNLCYMDTDMDTDSFIFNLKN